MKSIKTYLLNLLIKYIRWSSLRKSINVKGRYQIEEDKIIYYINNKSLKRKQKKNLLYYLETNYISLSSKLKKACNLDKTIEYRIENMNFEKAIKINTYYAKFYFKNCSFKDQIAVFCADTITLEHNHYINNTDVYFYGKSFLNISGYIDDLKFINDNLINSKTWKYSDIKPCFGIYAQKIGKLEIINSNLEASDLGEINIEQAKELIIEGNSKIIAPEIYMNVDTIKNSTGSIIAKKGMIIDNKENNQIPNISSPTIIYNGVDVSPKEQPLNIDESLIKLHLTRQELIKKLRTYSNECKKYLETQVIPNITVATVTKTLKKKQKRNIPK